MIPVPKALRPFLLFSLAVTPAAAPIAAQRIPLPPESVVPASAYSEYAELILAAPVIVDAAIHGTTRIKGPEAANVRPGYVRFYVEADVQALIRGPHPLPARIGYVADVRLDASGRAPKLRKLRVLLFARPASRPEMVQLVRLDAQRPWTPETDALVRRIVQEVVSPDAPPEVTGLGSAFHVPGTLPGEGETQIFLTTADNRPVSLSILRRPNQQPRWSVSLGDIVGEGAPPPPRDTLLWYRLACGLPTTLPDSSLSSADPADAAIAREDYQFVRTSLGRCGRGKPAL